MNKLSKYNDNRIDLEKNSEFKIKYKSVDEEDLFIKRQNIRIYILFIVIFIISVFVIKEYTYDFHVIRKAGLNPITLNENVIDNYNLEPYRYIS